MQYRHFPLTLLLACAAILSCSKEPVPEEKPEEKPEEIKYLQSFTGDLNNFTRASITVSTGKVEWEEGDSVAVQNGVESSIYVFDKTSGTFKSGKPLQYTDGFIAVYPASCVVSTLSSGFGVNIPQQQAYYPDAVKRAPMCAASEDDKFKFKNLCAVLQFNVKADSVFNRMSFTATSVPVCGEGIISRSGTLTLSEDAGKTASVSIPNTVSVTDSLPVCLYVPAQVYDGGFTIRIDYGSGVSITESTTESIALNGGVISTRDAFRKTQFSGGAGTITNPWKIATVEDLRFLSENSVTQSLSYNKDYYEQVCDIDFGGTELNAICRSNSFTGSYDGCGHKITGVTIVNPEKQPLGLFSTISSPGQVRNLTLDNANVSSSVTKVGGIVGYLNAGTVRNCSVGENVVVKQLTSKAHELGGIVGTTNGEALIAECTTSAKVSGPCGNVGGIAGTINVTSKIENCTATAQCTVEGGNSSSDSGCNIGGIVGYVSGVESYTNTASVSGCVSHATVTGHYCDNGGVVGRLNKGILKDCFFDGTVTCDFNDASFVMATGTSHSNTGGIVGWVSGKSTVLSNCRSSAKIKATSRFVGGVFGFSDSGDIHDCDFENGTIEAVSHVGGIAGCLYNYGVAACHVKNSSITASGGYAGGIAGYDYAAMISDSHFDEGSIILGGGSGKHRFGGIVGESYGYAAVVRECTVSGEIAPSGGIVGGAVGYLDYGLVRKTVLKKTAVVTSKDYNIVGGIAGQIPSHGGYIFDCSTEKGARVYGKSGCQYLGGIVGYVQGDSQISGCYSNVDISTGTPSGGIVGYLTSSKTAIANCLYYDASLQQSSFGSKTAGIVGQVNSTSTQNTIVNCAAYPSSAGEGVKGICADAASAQIINCYSPVDGGTEPTVDAMNQGADSYNNGTPLYAIRAESWVDGTNGKPVLAGCPIAAAEPAKKKIRVGLIGDSISTFTGWTPYPKGNGYPLAKWPDVTTVDQVYWHILIYQKMTGCELDVNSAYSGSCVMETTTYGYPGRGFLHRYTDLKNPDIILINGGTNDCNYASRTLPMGELNFDLPDDKLDLYSLAGAYDMLIRKLKVTFPSAKIGIICGDFPGRFRPEGKKIITDIADHYGLPCAVVEFPNSAEYTEGDDIHPNAKGHKFMADTIWEQFKGKFSE